jgi:hypothetical protein
MAKKEAAQNGDAELVFAARNTHSPNCGQPPRIRNTEPGRYYGYFENIHREQFVFTFDRKTGRGTVTGGDLDWQRPKSFTLARLDKALRATQRIAAQLRAIGRDDQRMPGVVDAALALGRLAGLTAREEVNWLRACLSACTYRDQAYSA